MRTVDAERRPGTFQVFHKTINLKSIQKSSYSYASYPAADAGWGSGSGSASEAAGMATSRAQAKVRAPRFTPWIRIETSPRPAGRGRKYREEGMK